MHELWVESTLRHQLVMVTVLSDDAFVDDVENVGVSHRRQTMRDDDSRSSLWSLYECEST